MIKKRNLVVMLLLLTAISCFAGCDEQTPIQGSTPTKKPVISAPATPTDAGQPVTEGTPAPTDAASSQGTITTIPQDTATPTPTPTNTPTPTATPTPTPTPTPIPTVPPAPVAVNIDTTTIDFIINRDHPLTEFYRPDDLVAPDIPFSFSNKTLDKRKLKQVAATALEELYNAALAEEGLTIYGVSGYRSYDRQYDIYGANLITRGIRHTNLYSAAPGNSEHQTGLAIDVSCQSVNFNLIERFASTPEGLWLKDNCWRFGFILRYPKDKEHITGYAYEPWHIRYVGVPLAYYLYTNNLTLEEYYGSPSSHTLEELEDRPLIDMTTDRFYKLYASTLGSELLYKEDGTIWLSDTTGLPHLKELIRDAAGTVIKVNGTPFMIEPILDADGNYVLDEATGGLLYTKPYFDAEGNLWLDYNGSPVYLQPLWNADGTLARDIEGNILYTEPEKTPAGLEIITETGSLTQKVPIRNIWGDLTFYEDGTVRFYEPAIDPLTGEYILDSSTGLPLYPYEYYEVPHNTLPLPQSYLPPFSKEDVPSLQQPVPEEPAPDDFFPEEAVPEEPLPEDPDHNTTTDETGGFFG